MTDEKQPAPVQPRLERFRQLVAMWQQRLGLGEFHIKVLSEKIEAHSNAETRRNSQAKRARIVLNSESIDSPESIGGPGLERIAIHELLHVAATELTDTVQDDLRHLLGSGVLYEVAIRAVHEAEERLCDRLCDRLAIALVRLAPLGDGNP